MQSKLRLGVVFLQAEPFPRRCFYLFNQLAMKNLLNKDVAIVVLIFVTIISFYSAVKEHSDNAGKDLVVYPMKCDQWSTGAKTFENCSVKRALTRRAFKLDEFTKDITEWDLDGKYKYFRNHKDCTMVNLDNWGCDTIHMVEGEFGDSNYEDALFVTKSQWESINNGKATPIFLDEQ